MSRRKYSDDDDDLDDDGLSPRGIGSGGKYRDDEDDDYDRDSVRDRDRDRKGVGSSNKDKYGKSKAGLNCRDDSFSDSLDRDSKRKSGLKEKEDRFKERDKPSSARPTVQRGKSTNLKTSPKNGISGKKNGRDKERDGDRRDRDRDKYRDKDRDRDRDRDRDYGDDEDEDDRARRRDGYDDDEYGDHERKSFDDDSDRDRDKDRRNGRSKPVLAAKSSASSSSKFSGTAGKVGSSSSSSSSSSASTYSYIEDDSDMMSGYRRSIDDSEEARDAAEVQSLWTWAGGFSDDFEEQDRKITDDWQLLFDKQKLSMPSKNTHDLNAILQFRMQLMRQKKFVHRGIPVQWKFPVWEFLAGARTLPDRLERTKTYEYYLKQAALGAIAADDLRNIKQDIPSALKSHSKYKQKDGVSQLKRVLVAFAMRNIQIGYATSLSHLAGFLLLFYDEERAFWLLCALVDIVLPPNYFSNGMCGSRADAQTIKVLIYARFEKLHKFLTNACVDIFPICLKWFMSLFTISFPIQSVIRIWDILFIEGPTFLLQLALAIFKVNEKNIVDQTDEIDLMNTLHSLGTEVYDLEELLKFALESRQCRISPDDLQLRNSERRIMEGEYMKELEATEKAKKIEEAQQKEERKQQDREAKALEKDLEHGTEMWKIPHFGSAQKKKIYLMKDGKEWIIRWSSKNKNIEESEILLSESMLFEGMKAGLFAKKKLYLEKEWRGQQHLAFSLISPSRSLDLVALKEDDYDDWITVLKKYVGKKPKEKSDDDDLVKE